MLFVGFFHFRRCTESTRPWAFVFNQQGEDGGDTARCTSSNVYFCNGRTVWRWREARRSGGARAEWHYGWKDEKSISPTQTPLIAKHNHWDKRLALLLLKNTDQKSSGISPWNRKKTLIYLKENINITIYVYITKNILLLYCCLFLLWLCTVWLFIINGSSIPRNCYCSSMSVDSEEIVWFHRFIPF